MLTKIFCVIPYTYLTVNVPPLLEFTFDMENKSETLRETRWNLLLWTIYGNSMIPDITKISSCFATLFTLLHLRIVNTIII